MQLADRVAALAAAAERAEERSNGALDALSTARGDECAANAALDVSGDDAALDAASKARIRRESAERVVATRNAEAESARQALAAVQVEAQRALYATAVDRIEAWQHGLREEVDALASLDRELGEIVERIAGKVVQAEDVWHEAADLARAIGEELVFKTRWRIPTLDVAKHLGTIGVTLARAKEQRSNDADGWLDGATMPGVHEEQERWNRAVALLTAEVAHAV